MITEKGFLLSYIKYGDYDAILHFFTQSGGFQSFYLRGLYSKNNRKKALLQPLLELQFNSSHSSKGLPKISNLQLAEKAPEWDVKINSIIFFLAEFLNQVLRDEVSVEEVYHELKLLLEQLKKNNLSAHIQFLIRLSKVLGIHPLLDEKPFLNPQKGVFDINPSHHLFHEEVSALWKKLQISSYDVPLTTSQRQQMLESLLVYFQIHIPGFRTPESLEIVQQIWT